MPAAAAEEPAQKRPRWSQPTEAPARAPAFVPTQAAQAQPARAYNAFANVRATQAQAGRRANRRVSALVL